MPELKLSLGPLQAAGFVAHRSGVQWLCEDGHLCRPNEVIAYCNISLQPQPGVRPSRTPFADERELQIAFAPRIAGRLRRGEGTSFGGYLDALGVCDWNEQDVIGFLEPLKELPLQEAEKAKVLRLQMLAGRRATGLADVLSGLLPGWHSRVRSWWGDEAGAGASTLLSLGICDATGPIRGEQGAFRELFESSESSAQFVYVPNHPITPCAPCLLEQFTRTPSGHQAIATDVMRALADGSVRPTADDWLFVGSLLAALDHSPMSESYDILTTKGLRKEGPATSILLSLNAEGPSILRHKTLGYRLHVQRVYQSAAGPAVRAWLASAFEPVKRSISDIQRDYSELFDTVGEATHFLILNRMSTSGHEDISSYAPFDAPMDETLANIASKELNLMLYDLAEAHNISIIDVDCLAAYLGGGAHLPDGMHQSGLLETHVRAEILSCLASHQAQVISNSTTMSPATAASLGMASA